jgi:hypothetical protein
VDCDWDYNVRALVPWKSGGWQFSYRYAMILLPWMFLLVTGNGPPKITVTEISLFAVSIAINGIAGVAISLDRIKIQPSGNVSDPLPESSSAGKTNDVV